jgi:hypothetical protein
MIVELDVPNSVNRGDAVPMTVRVRNDDTDPAELALTGRPIAFDLVVQEPDGTEVWRRLRGEMLSMVLQVRILEPGEALDFRDVWDQRDNAGRGVSAGIYVVRGVLASPDRQLTSEPRQLVISG